MSLPIDEQDSARLHTSHERLLGCKSLGLYGRGLKARLPRYAQSGVNQTTTQGRGTEFAELRPYSPGDDIRHMDWRATARSNEPWVKSFDSDLHFAATFVVDQRTALFFGTERYPKSLLTAELAAIAAWDHLALGFSVELIVVHDREIHSSRICRNRTDLEEQLKVLARVQQAGRAFAEESGVDLSGSLFDRLRTYASRRVLFCFSSQSGIPLLTAEQVAATREHHALSWVNVSDRSDTILDWLAGGELSGFGSSVQVDTLKPDSLSAFFASQGREHEAFAQNCETLEIPFFNVRCADTPRFAYEEHSGFGLFARAG